VIIHSMYALGIKPDFWRDKETEQSSLDDSKESGNPPDRGNVE